MAVDTAAKRRSAGGVPFLPLGPGVSPDAARPAAWRQEAGWGYSGIPASPPVVVGVAVAAAFLAVDGAPGFTYDPPPAGFTYDAGDV